MYLLNNLKININAPLTGPNGTQYPANWFTDAQERALVGIIEVSDPVYPDPLLYSITENPDGSLTTHKYTTLELKERKAQETPQEVSRFQARAALSNAGLLTTVETLMVDPTTPTLTKLAWEDAQVF